MPLCLLRTAATRLEYNFWEIPRRHDIKLQRECRKPFQKPELRLDCRETSQIVKVRVYNRCKLNLKKDNVLC